MPEVFVAAGGNIEPRRRLRQALALLSAAYPDLRISPAYANRAVGFDGEDFVNLVVGFHTDEPLAQVLETLHGIEAACGRPREAARWAPRAMDLDVLLYGSDTGAYPGVVLPRPDLLKRAFMLGPLADLAPGLVHPVAGVTMAELWRRFDRAAHELRPIEL